MRFTSLVLLAFFFYTLPAYAEYQKADEPQTPSRGIGMVTGSSTGTYIAFGKDIAREAAKAGVKVYVYPSKGSIDNINRITSKEKVGLAIVQSDVLSFLSRSKNTETIKTAKEIRLVAPLYSEEVHIMVNNPNIKTIQDLAGKRIIAGGDGSGSVLTAENIFSTLDIIPSKLYETDPPHGIIALLDNEVDAFVYVAGKPIKIFKNMEDLSKITQGPNAGKLQNVHFLPITDPRLLKDYKPATLTHNDYSFVSEDVPTVAVTALLVTRDYMTPNTRYAHAHCRMMYKLVKSLYANMDDLKANGHPKWREVNLDANVGSWKRDVCSEKGFPEEVVRKKDNISLENDLLGVVRGK